VKTALPTMSLSLQGVELQPLVD